MDLAQISKVWHQSWPSKALCAKDGRYTHRNMMPARILSSSSSSSNSFDLVVLSYVCVDILLPVAVHPPSDASSRKALLTEQQASLAKGSRAQWEVGGSCNLSIAAARLGLRSAICGEASSDTYGQYIQSILKVSEDHHLDVSTSITSRARSDHEVSRSACRMCHPPADSPMHAADSVLAICMMVLSMTAATAAAAARLQHADRQAELHDFVLTGRGCGCPVRPDLQQTTTSSAGNCACADLCHACW